MIIRHAVILLLLLTNLSACSYMKNINRKEECEKSLKAYRQMIRWNESEKAAVAIVDRENRETFSKAAEAMRRKNISMVDVRMLSEECLSEKGTAEATVEFDYFIMPDSRMRTLTDRQKWIYREEVEGKPELGKGWKLVTPLPAFK